MIFLSEDLGSKELQGTKIFRARSKDSFFDLLSLFFASKIFVPQKLPQSPNDQIPYL